MIKKIPQIRGTAVQCLLFLIIFIAGIYIGGHYKNAAADVTGVVNKESALVTDADFAAFWKVWSTIDEKYPSADADTSQNRVYGAIKGLVSSLDDPYSVFFSPAETKDFEATINGSFGGIGVEIGMKDKVLTVIAPLKNTPGFNAGIKPGDKILKIDDTVTNDISIDQAISLIRGEKGTTVKLTILRDGETEPREIPIVRGIINIPTLDTNLRSDGIFVISFYNFSANAATLFKSAMKEFIASGSHKLIIDLRGNPGGFLDGAIDTASWFLPEGDVIVRENFGSDKEEEVHRSLGYSGVDLRNTKVVILVDGGSASAAEIFAGALSEQHAATLVGEKTYGKGSVQELIDVTPDTALKLTIAKWLTPNGVSISKQGITPDVIVPIAKEDTDAKRDPQLDKAIEILQNK